MNCPYCAKEMESGYLRGGSGYELVTEESVQDDLSPDRKQFLRLQSNPDAHRPIAHLCRAWAARSFWDIKNKKAPRISRPTGGFAKIYHTAFRRIAANRLRAPRCILKAYGGKQAPIIGAPHFLPHRQKQTSALQLTKILTS